MCASSEGIPFPQSRAEVWIEGYNQGRLVQKDAATVDAYWAFSASSPNRYSNVRGIGDILSWTS